MVIIKKQKRKIFRMLELFYNLTEKLTMCGGGLKIHESSCPAAYLLHTTYLLFTFSYRRLLEHMLHSKMDVMKRRSFIGFPVPTLFH